jgi:hypothetical protein
MALSFGEFLFSIAIRSLRIKPLRSEVVDVAKLAMFARTFGQVVISDPRCGVPKKIIPFVDSLIPG